MNQFMTNSLPVLDRYTGPRALAIVVISIAVFAGIGLGGTGFAGLQPEPDAASPVLDRDGADFVPAREAGARSGMDVTTLYLDRDGADMPSGSWWHGAAYAGSSSYRGPDITGLNLDRDGADVVAN